MPLPDTQTFDRILWLVRHDQLADVKTSLTQERDQQRG
jgi:hypothetical protein